MAGGQRNAAGVYALPDTQNQAWSSDKSRFGSRMLEKFGWSSGKGLGKKEDGIVEHVRVVKRSEALGLGARPVGAGSEAALSNAVADYNAILASLAATAAPQQAQAQAQAPPRGKRARSSSEASGASSEAPPPPPPRAPGAPPVRLIGRFAHHRALRQKNVAGYSAADLQAILGTHGLGAGGAAGGAGDAVALPCAPVVQRASISLSVVRKKKRKDGEDEEGRRERKEKKRKRREAEAAAEAAAATAAGDKPSKKERKRREAEAAAAAAEAAAAAAEAALPKAESREEREARREAKRERKRQKQLAKESE